MNMINIRRAFAGIGAGLLALVFATTGQAQASSHPRTDCQRIARTYQSLCRTVSHQRAYGYTDDIGNPQNWTTNGRALVHEITHQGYTQAEMIDALTGAARDYRDHVSAIRFNVDTITRTCGHHMGNGVVQEIKGTDGRYYTWTHIVCD